MRLLLAFPDVETIRLLCQELNCTSDWDLDIASNGEEVVAMVQTNRYDLLVIHACLSCMDGLKAGHAIASLKLICPPKVLLLCPHEYRSAPVNWADCVTECGVSIHRLSLLIHILMQKPLPVLAAANLPVIEQKISCFLDELHLKQALKGRSYAAWILMRLIPAASNESKPLGDLYRACANAFHTSPSAVERCLRIAIESIFTMGSLKGIEHYFGSSVDPDKGKLTNRAFLLKSAQYLRLNITP